MSIKNKKVLFNMILWIILSSNFLVGCGKSDKNKNYSLVNILDHIDLDNSKLDEALLNDDLIKKYNELSEYIKYSEIIQNYLMSNNFEVEVNNCKNCSIDNYVAKFGIPEGNYYRYESNTADYSLIEIKKIVNDLNDKKKIENNVLVDALVSCNKKISKGIELDNKVRSAIIDAAFSDIDNVDYTCRDIKWNIDIDYYESLTKDIEEDGKVYTSIYSSPNEAFCDINNIDKYCMIDGSALFDLCSDYSFPYEYTCDCLSNDSYYNAKFVDYLENTMEETEKYAINIYRRRIK